MRDTAEKLRKLMEQFARQQNEYMTTKDQLTSLEKAKVCNPPSSEHCDPCSGSKSTHCLHTQAALDIQVKDLTTRLEEGLNNSTKVAKREAAKLQARVGSLSTRENII